MVNSSFFICMWLKIYNVHVSLCTMHRLYMNCTFHDISPIFKSQNIKKEIICFTTDIIPRSPSGPVDYTPPAQQPPDPGPCPGSTPPPQTPAAPGSTVSSSHHSTPWKINQRMTGGTLNHYWGAILSMIQNIDINLIYCEETDQYVAFFYSYIIFFGRGWNEEG